MECVMIITFFFVFVCLYNLFHNVSLLNVINVYLVLYKTVVLGLKIKLKL